MSNCTSQPNFITLSGLADDITGQTFSRLTALGPVSRTEYKSILWLCQCLCGNSVIVATKCLKGGHTKSCGCLRKDNVKRALTTHGLSYKKEHGIWRNIIGRCYRKTHAAYTSYGGRGIRMYEPWLTDAKAFCDYISALPGYGEPGLSLDRIDNDGNYEPGNLRWATATQQSNNQRPRSK